MRHTSPEQIFETVRKLRLIDDDFMQLIFEDKACCEVLLHVILDRDDLTVTNVQVQAELKNLQGRSVRLDILATDTAGKQYNIEVQRADTGATPKRARYNSSMLDMHSLQPGDSFDSLNDNYVIFITEHDILGYGKPLYTIDRTIKEADNALFDDCSHIVYVNGEIRNETKLGQLMQDFFCEEPREMHYNPIATRVHYYKEHAKEENRMCQIIRDFIDGELDRMSKELTEELTEEVTASVTERVTEEVTERVTEEVTERVTEEVTERVTEEVTANVTASVTESVTESKNAEFIKNLLTMNKLSHAEIAAATGLPLLRVEEIAAQLQV